MTRARDVATQSLWGGHSTEWREPAEIVSHFRGPSPVDSRMLQSVVRGRWWELLSELGICLFVTREYEHLVLALHAATNGSPSVSYLPMPHPSGLAFDRRKRIMHLASTRNPNEIYEFRPLAGVHQRLDIKPPANPGRPMMPVASRFLPGSCYVHDLAVVNGALHLNAVGHNAIMRLRSDGSYRRVWWPKSIETGGGPMFDRNHLQLNSIAAGRRLRESYFSASTPLMGRRRPGHLNFPVDRRGVIFSGKTREPVISGLTRPHSARLHRGQLWVDNSGYGELLRCNVSLGTTEVAARLPGWTRGLAMHGQIAFVGTSRVIPRFRRYAPGLDVERSVCGIHAVDLSTGSVLGSITWPWGNQIFAIDWAPTTMTTGFPFRFDGGKRRDTASLFYAYRVAQ